MTILLNRKTQALAKDIVLIDGFSSTGKALIAPILGHLKRCEQWQIKSWLDHIATLYYLKKITQSSATALIKILADELIYNLFLGRNVNFRATDYSSPHFDGLQKKYLKRLKQKEGKYAVNKILRSKPILPLVVHNVYGNSKILLKAFENRLKLYIICLRDPLVIIQKWYSGNWPKRIYNDPRFFKLCLNSNSKIIPWYAKNYSKKYNKANDIEKSILSVCKLYKGVISMYKKASKKEKKKILFIFFEDFIKNPNLYINYICKKIKTIPNKNINYYLKKVSLPRNDTNEFDLKKYKSNNFDKKISKRYQNKLKKLNDLYINFYNEHKLSNKNYAS